MWKVGWYCKSTVSLHGHYIWTGHGILYYIDSEYSLKMVKVVEYVKCTEDSCEKSSHMIFDWWCKKNVHRNSHYSENINGSKVREWYYNCYICYKVYLVAINIENGYVLK